MAAVAARGSSPLQALGAAPYRARAVGGAFGGRGAPQSGGRKLAGRGARAGGAEGGPGPCVDARRRARGVAKRGGGAGATMRAPGKARERREPCAPCRSFLGVGAPEALVVGVVALLVFGPKGLAEAARSLGQALRAFQPTIKELQEVSQEFKSTLESEIGLDDLQKDIDAVRYGSPPTPSPTPPASDDATVGNPEAAKPAADATVAAGDDGEDLESMRKMSEQMAWGGTPPSAADSPIPPPTDEASAPPADDVEADEATPPTPTPPTPTPPPTPPVGKEAQ